ncbi:hypothetical protein H8E77_07770 [bacterium]|nr:hypothetical protein [bacterium]
MIDVFKIAEILVDNVKAKYADDIAIVAYYGSYAQGRANEKSDLDFFYIPDSIEKVNASLQFVLDEIGFDFWPISWERAERIASFDEAIVSVIADSKVLYARSDADSARFDTLKDKVSALCKPENNAVMLYKAFDCLKDCYMYLYNMRLPASENNLATTRFEAYKVMTTVMQSLALLNQTYFSRGLGQNMEQVLALVLKPDGLDELLNRIMTQSSCAKIKSLCKELVNKTRELLISEQRVLSRSHTHPDVFTGFYEEAKGTFNKIISACERNDYDTAFFASLSIQNEISLCLAIAEEGVEYTGFNTYSESGKAYGNLELPDLAGMIENGKLNILKNAVIELDEKMKGILKMRGVCLNIFDTLDEFKSFVQNKPR